MMCWSFVVTIHSCKFRLFLYLCSFPPNGAFSDLRLPLLFAFVNYASQRNQRKKSNPLFVLLTIWCLFSILRAVHAFLHLRRFRTFVMVFFVFNLLICASKNRGAGLSDIGWGSWGLGRLGRKDYLNLGLFQRVFPRWNSRFASDLLSLHQDITKFKRATACANPSPSEQEQNLYQLRIFLFRKSRCVFGAIDSCWHACFVFVNFVWINIILLSRYLLTCTAEIWLNFCKNSLNAPEPRIEMRSSSWDSWWRFWTRVGAHKCCQGALFVAKATLANLLQIGELELSIYIP